MNRVFLFVLDSFGIGALPDASDFSDAGANTLASCARSAELHIPNLIAAGLGNIDGVTCLPKAVSPTGCYGRLAEASMGKDTTIGHWELAGLYAPAPLPTYPQGFPQEVLEAFEEATGRGVLCNLPYSGTQVIQEYGLQQKETGKWIVYTSADSVFQVAANEEWIPLEELYEACRKARSLLKGKHGVGRVIARPYVGSSPDTFRRTSNRHDFSLEPPERTMLDAIKEAGLASIGVGKIYDIFAGIGLTEHVYNTSNANGLEHADHYAGKDFRGLCFVNLVDFDMLYGHRRDIDGYARALSQFDAWLPGFLEKLGPEDLVLITADHGCDPGYTASTDHTREYVPLLALGKGVKPGNLGTLPTFSAVAATVTELLGVPYSCNGNSFAKKLEGTPEKLMELAKEAMTHAYVPYSGYQVGAALLCADGSVYCGCNIENAAYGPTNCAERTAFFKAVYDGKRDFSAIAVCGGKGGVITGTFPPCGVCRQVMREFCKDDFLIYMIGPGDRYETHTLAEILPFSFRADIHMQQD